MKEPPAAPSSSQGIPEQHFWGNIQVLLSLNRRRGWEWEEFCSLPTPFVSLLFSQLQPRPISAAVTDSSQHLPTWPLSMGMTRKLPGPGPDGKKDSATLANKSTCTLNPRCLALFIDRSAPGANQLLQELVSALLRALLIVTVCLWHLQTSAQESTASKSLPLHAAQQHLKPSSVCSLSISAVHKTWCSWASLKRFKWKRHLPRD